MHFTEITPPNMSTTQHIKMAAAQNLNHDCVGNVVMTTTVNSTSKNSSSNHRANDSFSILEYAARVVLEERLGCGKAQQYIIAEVLADIGTYWRNGNPVAIEIFLRDSTDEMVDDPRKTPTSSEIVLEMWDLELCSIMQDANAIPCDEVDDAKIEEMQKLMILAMRSFLHFSPLNAWMLKNKRVREHLWCRVSNPIINCSKKNGHSDSSQDDNNTTTTTNNNKNATSVSTDASLASLGLTGKRRFKPLLLPQQQSELMLNVCFQTQQPVLPWFDFEPRAGDENEDAKFMSPTKSSVPVVCGLKRDRNSPSMHSPQPNKPIMRPRLETVLMHHRQHHPTSSLTEMGDLTGPTKMGILKPSNLFGLSKQDVDERNTTNTTGTNKSTSSCIDGLSPICPADDDVVLVNATPTTQTIKNAHSTTTTADVTNSPSPSPNTTPHPTTGTDRPRFSAKKTAVVKSHISSSIFHEGTGLPLASSPDPRKRQMMFERQMQLGQPSASSATSSLSGSAQRTKSAPIPIKSGRSFGSLGSSSLSRSKGDGWEASSNNLCSPSSSSSSSSARRGPTFAHGRITDSPPRNRGSAGITSNAAFQLHLTNSLISPPLLHSTTGSLLRPRVNSLDRQFGIGAKRLLGSYEESLLSGRMNNWSASSVKGFVAELGACGAGKTPPHVRLPLNASFYKIPGESSSSAPYVGTLDLSNPEASGHKALKNGRYRVPASGLVQLMIYNPQKTGVKVFLVKYDFRSMPAKTRTFLRQSTYLEIPSSRTAKSPSRRKQLLYAIHLRFVCTKPGRIYLDKDIRVVFSHRAPDLNDKVKTVTEGPKNPMYSPIKSNVNSSIANDEPERNGTSRSASLSLSDRNSTNSIFHLQQLDLQV